MNLETGEQEMHAQNGHLYSLHGIDAVPAAEPAEAAEPVEVAQPVEVYEPGEVAEPVETEE